MKLTYLELKKDNKNQLKVLIKINNKKFKKI
jgi:hypothetical protein